MVYHPAGEVAAPILMYHRINNQMASRYVVRVDAFQKQMQILADGGYQSVTVSELRDVMVNGGYLPEKPVVLTFDDGYVDVFENAYPILNELGFTGTAYVITGTLGTDLSYGYMQTDQLAELAAAGWEIGSHSVTHSDLRNSKLGILNELEQSKQVLEDQLGVTVRSFSYPFAVKNAWMQEQVAAYGYDSAVGVGMPTLHKPENLFYMSRREVDYGTSLYQFEKMLMTPTETPTPEGTVTETPEN